MILLNEIFEDVAKISWKSVNEGYRGSFEIGGNKYTIHLDEYVFNFKSSGKRCEFVDIGFVVHTADGESWTATNFNKNQVKILGTVLGGVREKILKIKPDALIFGVNFKNGDVEKRLSIYKRMAKMYAKMSYGIMQDKIKTPNGEYIAAVRSELSSEEIEDINKFVQDHVKLK